MSNLSALKISVFDRAADEIADVHTTDRAAFLEDLRNPEIVDEPATPQSANALKLRTAAWSPATFRENHKLRRNVETCSCLVYDLDGKDKQGVSTEDLCQKLRSSGLNYAVHSTARSGFCAQGLGKFRVILFLDADVSAEAYDKLWLATKDRLEIEPDTTRRGPEGIYFAPAIFREHLERYVSEGRLDGVDLHADEAPARRTFTKSISRASVGGLRTEESWLESVRGAREKMHALQRAVYAVAILRTAENKNTDDLEELFEAALTENFRRGSSPAVEDWAHARREIAKLCAAGVEQAQLERVEEEHTAEPRVVELAGKKLAKTLKELSAGTTTLKSAAHVLGRFTHALPEVDVTEKLYDAYRKSTTKSGATLLGEREVREAIQQGLSAGANAPVGLHTADNAWREELQTDKELNYTVSWHNVSWVFMHHPVAAGALGTNVRTGCTTYLKAPPWAPTLRAGTEHSEALETSAAHWLGRREILGNKGASHQHVAEALRREAKANQYDPLLVWLDTLPSATTHDFLETLFIKYAGAEDTPYVRLVTRLWFTAMYARQVEPGTDVEAALIFSGEQRQGKTRFLRELFPSELESTCFTSDLPSWEDKDLQRTLASCALVELGELARITKAQLETIKNQMTMTQSRKRLAYDRAETLLRRRAVFSGTTNEGEFLIDKTGERRFWPLRVTGYDWTELAARREQIWSEAKGCYDRGLGWHATTEEYKTLIVPAHAPFKVEDMNVSALEELLDEPIGLDHWTREASDENDETKEQFVFPEQGLHGEKLRWVKVTQLIPLVWGRNIRGGSDAAGKTVRTLLRAHGWTEGKTYTQGERQHRVWRRPGLGTNV